MLMYIKHAKHTIGLLVRSLESYTMLIDGEYIWKIYLVYFYV